MAPLSSSVKHFKRSNKSSEEKNNEDGFGDTTGKQIKIQNNLPDQSKVLREESERNEISKHYMLSNEFFRQRR